MSVLFFVCKKKSSTSILKLSHAIKLAIVPSGIISRGGAQKKFMLSI